MESIDQCWAELGSQYGQLPDIASSPLKELMTAYDNPLLTEACWIQTAYILSDLEDIG